MKTLREMMIIQTSDAVYLSSKMNGEAFFGYPLFYAMEETLKKTYGCKVVNPARHFKGRTDLAYEEYLRKDLTRMLRECNVVVLFGNWKKSKGALLEASVALSCGLIVLERHGVDLVPISLSEADCVRLRLGLMEESSGKSVCQIADQLVSGDRNDAYGPPDEDYKRTTETFNALTGHSLSVLDGIMFMVCVKLSRLKHKFSRDSVVDAIGYLKCFEMTQKKLNC